MGNIMIQRSKAIVDMIKATRINRGMSQKELSEKSGISTVTISKIENHRVIPRMSNLLRICQALEIKITMREIMDDIFDTFS